MVLEIDGAIIQVRNRIIGFDFATLFIAPDYQPLTCQRFKVQPFQAEPSLYGRVLQLAMTGYDQII